MSPPVKLPSLRGNVIALGLLQASNYVVPLVMLPYLTRVLGAEAFGKVVFAQALMAYAVLLVDYGFTWSATREVAANRHDHRHISRVFAGTWAAQWLLFVLAALMLAVALMLSHRLQADAELYIAAFLTVFGGLLFPVWFFQGLEQLKAVAVLQFFIRALALIPIFIYVSQPDHAVRVLIINGVISIIGGCAALYWLHRKQWATWQAPTCSGTVQALRSGAALFGSRVSISFYTNLVPIALGWLAGPVAVAYFNVADKLRSAGQSLIGPIAQALFPRMSHLAQTDKAAAFRLLKTSTLVVAAVGGSASVGLWLLAEWLVVLLAGSEFAPAASVLRWLAFLPLVIGFSNLLGVQLMLPKGMNRPFNVILLLAGILGATAVWPLAGAYGAVGAAQTLFFVELFVTLAMALLLWRMGLLSANQWRSV